MLGNFSFNDYFKKEAIEYAWKFLTEILNIDKNRIHATYFEGNSDIDADKESLEILKSIAGLKEIKPQGADDNFWSLGTENSPGGPTVEFYIDNIEVWNLVFNEYVFKNGKYEKSEFRGVDTGMGFERILAILNNKSDVYQTDLFAPMLENTIVENQKIARIIADHIKAAVFILNDGVVPSNKDAGYIVRRLIRRAMVKSADIELAALAQKVFEIYDGVYEFKRDFIIDEIKKEENKFQSTLSAGLRILKSKTEIAGQDLFDLYQSYGLPMEIAVEEVKNQNIAIGQNAFGEYDELYRSQIRPSNIIALLIYSWPRLDKF